MASLLSTAIDVLAGAGDCPIEAGRRGPTHGRRHLGVKVGSCRGVECPSVAERVLRLPPASTRVAVEYPRAQRWARLYKLYV